MIKLVSSCPCNNIQLLALFRESSQSMAFYTFDTLLVAVLLEQ